MPHFFDEAVVDHWLVLRRCLGEENIIVRWSLCLVFRRRLIRIILADSVSKFRNAQAFENLSVSIPITQSNFPSFPLTSAVNALFREDTHHRCLRAPRRKEGAPPTRQIRRPFFHIFFGSLILQEAVYTLRSLLIAAGVERDAVAVAAKFGRVEWFNGISACGGRRCLAQARPWQDWCT